MSPSPGVAGKEIAEFCCRRSTACVAAPMCATEKRSWLLGGAISIDLRKPRNLLKAGPHVAMICVNHWEGHIFRWLMMVDGGMCFQWLGSYIELYPLRIEFPNRRRLLRITSHKMTVAYAISSCPKCASVCLGQQPALSLSWIFGTAMERDTNLDLCSNNRATNRTGI